MDPVMIQGILLVIISIFSQSAAQCSSFEFIKYVDMHVSGGTLQLAYTTLDQCRNGCLSNPGQCIGVDWVPSTSVCWFISNYRTPIEPLSGVDHYRLESGCPSADDDRYCTIRLIGKKRLSGTTNIISGSTVSLDSCAQGCVANTQCRAFEWRANSCRYFISDISNIQLIDDSLYTTYVMINCTGCPVFKEYPLTKATNMRIPLQSYTTLDACKQACLSNADCQGIDYVATETIKCYFVQTANPTRADDPTSNNYKVECRGAIAGCTPIWNKTVGIHAIGGSPYTAATTESDCLKACAADQTCQGVDIDTNPGAQAVCWFHKNTSDFSNTPSASGLILYVLVDRCRLCIPSWKNETDMHALNGIPETQYTTESACIKACVASQTCVGVDIDRVGTNLCWFHTSQADYTQTGTQAGVTMYQILDRCPTATTATTTVTTISGCTPSWTTTADVSSPNGQPRTDIRDMQSCRDACVSDVTCVAIDVDSTANAPALCWLHNSVSNLNIKRNTPGITQHVINRNCTTATTATTTSSCAPDWTLRTNTGSPNGMAEVSATTVDLCKKACIDNENCVAIDVDLNPGNNLCWLHLSASNINIVRTANGVSQYRIIRCGQTAPTTTENVTPSCTPVWSLKNSTSSPGAEAMPGLTTVQACQDSCVADMSCVAIDVDFNSQTILCWHHKSKTNLDTVRSTPNIYQYRLDSRCGEVTESSTTSSTSTTTTTTTATTTTTTPTTTPPTTTSSTTAPKTTARGCTPKWQITQNTHAFNGVVYSEATTPEACTAACVADPTCVGVDIDTNPNAMAVCWFHTNKNDFKDTGLLNGVTLYELLDRCQEVAPTTTPPNCKPQWKATNNTHAYNGVSYTAAKTKEECLAYCVQTESCVGVDIDMNLNTVALCWIHTNAADFTDTASQNNVQMYQLVDRCPAACQPVWSVTNGTHAGNGELKSNLMTAEACMMGCLDEERCVGYDLDYNGPVSTLCWFHYDKADFMSENLRSRDKTYLYRLVDRCPSTATTERPVTLTTTDRSTTTPGCEPRWQVTNNTHAFNGRALSNITKMEDCLAACVSDATCVAVDLDYNGPVLCWMHTSQSDLSDTEAASNVYLYRLVDRCESETTSEATTSVVCQPSWSTQSNTHADGGVTVPGIGTESACLQACIEEPTCVAVDVDKIDGPQAPIVCWMHKSVENLKKTSPLLLVDHWVLDRCSSEVTTQSGSEVCGMYEYIGYNANGGQNLGIVSSQGVCASMCYSDPTCQAADYSRDTGTCYKHTSLMPGQPNRCCVRYERVCQIGGCYDKFDRRQNSKGQDGLLMTSANTVDKCKQACLASAACYGFDFSKAVSTPMCLIYNMEFVNDLTFNTQYDAYVRIRCITPGTLTPTPAPSTEQPVARCVGDVLFVIDNSDGVGSALSFNKIKNFMIDLIQRVTVGSDFVRVSVVTYSDSGNVAFDLNDNVNFDTTRDKINQIQYRGTMQADMASGLNSAANVVFTNAGGYRANQRNIVIMVSTKASTNPYLNEAIATIQLKADQIFVIGVGNQVNQGQLQSITLPGRDRNIYINNFDELMNSINIDMLGICSTSPTLTPAPQPTFAPTPAPTPRPTPTPVPIKCPLDLALVVDSSGSIKDNDPKNWDNILEFLRKLVERIDLSNIRLAELSFGSKSRITFYFDQYRTVEEYQAAINNTFYDYGDTNTTGALRTARTQLFVENRGDRPEARNAILLVTDGRPTVEFDPESLLYDEVRRVKSHGLPSGTQIIGVGVAGAVDTEVMMKIVSGNLYFAVNQFDNLLRRLDEIAGSVCIIPTTPEPTTPPPPRCALDFAFVVDSSGSIKDKGAENWDTVKEFTKSVVRILDINQVKFAAISFGSSAFIQFGFDNGFTTKQQYYDALDKMTYDGGSTNTTGALRLARLKFFQSTSLGNRPDVNDVILLITDGNVTLETGQYAEETRQVKALPRMRVIAVGVTNDVVQSKLEEAATDDNGRKLIYRVENFSGLEAEVNNILSRSCSVPTGRKR